MLAAFGDTVVQAFGQTYSLDLSSLDLERFHCLLCIGVSLLALLAFARRFDRSSLKLTLAVGSLATFWGAVYLCFFRLPLSRASSEGHIYDLYWPQLRPVLCLMGLAAWLFACAVTALVLARAPEVAKQPLERQLRMLWPRALLVPILAAAWWLSLGGVRVFEQLRLIGHVPALEFPEHPRVQVGHPFSIQPALRVVGLVQRHLFSAATAVYLDEEDRRPWQLPAGPFVADQSGDRSFSYKIVRERPLRFSIESRFHVLAVEERGNPLMTLHKGDLWRYRVAGPVRSPQVLISAFERNVPPEVPKIPKTPKTGRAPRPEPSPPRFVTIQVSGARIEDGVRFWELEVEDPLADKVRDRRARYDVTMWDGETYVELGTKRTPLLFPIEGELHQAAALFPCRLAVLPDHRDCLCNSQPLDEKRALTGLARCMHHRLESHTGEALMSLGINLLTLGMARLGYRKDEHFYSGLLLMESGTVQ
ncbi:MAG: hypothetical protein U1A78_32390 [Polyangia bacterium]